MWPAPTAEDWAKPCLITWQRSFEDAVTVAQETGKAILICVNMDGEIASEHYAGIRYRQAEIAALYEPYVCVIASVYRHNPRDFDEEGRRIPCPRFGTVTCGEHIAIEPGLYDKYFEGTRVAPRHIALELDGQEMYDVYYAWDTDSVFQAIEDGIRQRPEPPPPPPRGDRSLLDRIASRDVRDREALEAAYREADRDLKQAMLTAALQKPEGEQTDLLRLAIFGLDPELSRLARQALAKSRSPQSVGLIAEALQTPMEAGEKETLLQTLEKLGQKSPKARSLAGVYRGLGSASQSVSLKNWSTALAENSGSEQSGDWQAIESRLDYQGAMSKANPDDPEIQLQLVEASLALAVDPQTAEVLNADPRTAAQYGRLLFEDVRQHAEKAEALGAEGWRLHAAFAVAAHHLGNQQEAYARAIQAVEAGMPEQAQGWTEMLVMALFASARQSAIADAIRQKRDWPHRWLSDVHAAYNVLAEHPHGTEAQVAAHYDFMKAMGVRRQAARILDRGLQRFPGSWDLHQRFRDQVLERRGAEALEPTYDALLARPDAPALMHWYAGFAALTTAEYHKRAGRLEQTQAAYERALQHYENSIQKQAETRETSDHYIALILAGQARLALEAGDLSAALADILASFDRRPQAAASFDGLGFSPVATAKMLLSQLQDEEGAAMRQRLQQALDQLEALDPSLLELPAYERGIPQ